MLPESVSGVASLLFKDSQLCAPCRTRDVRSPLAPTLSAAFRHGHRIEEEYWPGRILVFLSGWDPYSCKGRGLEAILLAVLKKTGGTCPAEEKRQAGPMAVPTYRGPLWRSKDGLVLVALESGSGTRE